MFTVSFFKQDTHMSLVNSISSLKSSSLFVVVATVVEAAAAILRGVDDETVTTTSTTVNIKAQELVRCIVVNSIYLDV
jgi:hypothetical protein